MILSLRQRSSYNSYATMAVTKFVFLVIAAFELLHMTKECVAMRIEINPNKCTSTIENAVHISCKLDSTDVEGREITFLELSRNDRHPIAFIRDCSNVSYGDDIASQFVAEGNIHKTNPSRSYLTVTFLNPKSEDTGVYTCAMYTVDPKGHILGEKSSDNLVVDKLDIKSLELVLYQLKDNISSLETNYRKEIRDLKESEFLLRKRLKDLEETSGNHSQEIAGLSDKQTYVSAFSVYNKNHVTTTTGKILILPDVIMKRGPGYDEKTGIFTAPRAGLYVFHAVVLVRKGCRFDLLLKTNILTLAKIFASYTEDYSQSSMSSVVELSVGEQVYLEAADSCNLYPSQYTVFTGYLIQAF